MKNNWKLIKQLYSESQFGREKKHTKNTDKLGKENV